MKRKKKKKKDYQYILWDLYYYLGRFQLGNLHKHSKLLHKCSNLHLLKKKESIKNEIRSDILNFFLFAK